MLPTPIHLPHLGVVRVFFTCCDSAGISRPAYADVPPQDPTRVIGGLHGPLMDIGAPGTFDESGIICTSVIQMPDGRLFMYYVGFEIGTRIRYRLLTGLAISEDDGNTFKRYSPSPILERSADELYFRCGPYVVRQDDRFLMWYVAGSDWLEVSGKMMPRYRIKSLESEDGITWPDSGKLVIDITQADEHGFGRPWVVPGGPDGHEMYYSVRRKSFGAYRMGYATSTDRHAWQRKDAESGLDAGPEPFDSQAIMYAAVMELGGRTYCFYNGNEFGKDGFAIAVREDA